MYMHLSMLLTHSPLLLRPQPPCSKPPLTDGWLANAATAYKLYAQALQELDEEWTYHMWLGKLVRKMGPHRARAMQHLEAQLKALSSTSPQATVTAVPVTAAEEEDTAAAAAQPACPLEWPQFSGMHLWLPQCLHRYALACRLACRDGQGVIEPVYRLHAMRLKLAVELHAHLKPAAQFQGLAVAKTGAPGRLPSEMPAHLRQQMEGILKGGSWLLGQLSRHCFLLETADALHKQVPQETPGLSRAESSVSSELAQGEQAQGQGQPTRRRTRSQAAGPAPPLPPVPASGRPKRGKGSKSSPEDRSISELDTMSEASNDGSSFSTGSAGAGPGAGSRPRGRGRGKGAAASKAVQQAQEQGQQQQEPEAEQLPSGDDLLQKLGMVLEDARAAMRWCADSYRSASGNQQYYRARYQLARAAFNMGDPVQALAELHTIVGPGAASGRVAKGAPVFGIAISQVKTNVFEAAGAKAKRRRRSSLGTKQHGGLREGRAQT